MLHGQNAQQTEIESGFTSFDGTRLFYRAWLPSAIQPAKASRVLVFLHRGHEHSARIRPLIRELVQENDCAFAWDARGHGHSPGERGDAPDFYTLVRDFNAFIAHLIELHGLAMENIFLVANSVGAVIAATWLHDFAPRIRGVIMAAAAFDINLYVPLAKPALRLGMRFQPDLCVSSYIRSSMLTHSPEQARAYDQDPLITKNIAARVLLDLADTAQRIVEDAQAIDTPILMLVADQDYVVKQKPQQLFFMRLAADLKRYIVLKDCHHAIFYEEDTKRAFQESRDFIDACFSRPCIEASHYCAYDQTSSSASRHDDLLKQRTTGWLTQAFYSMQKHLLRLIGPLSDGMRIGLETGFDSGSSLDYVYNNRASGRLGIGKLIDRNYLDAIGWRGIRLRKIQLQQQLGALIESLPADRTLRILDIAAGGGRYVLETLKRFQDRQIDLTLRDYEQGNLELARKLANNLQLNTRISYQRRDAFDPASYPDNEARYDIVIVSGLYELFAANGPVLQSLQGISRQTRNGGYLIYTGQPWHPQLDLIAGTLTDHQKKMWTMRPRPQVEIDALVSLNGFRKIDSQIGLAGIFTVSLAQKVAAHDVVDSAPSTAKAEASPAAGH